ncbi:hypothetical protein DSCO28_56570 [Desulfosarcina ovata subsp. sediminis]|uniref:Tripartite ATP-independent periplasmic transporters DctQ component domain-containing protein n=1 Tax=Desulfosarcina ovata subsp. sediminis TaxID=885957 RepID=A0A5K7ZYA8_9BACT|nr:TRAP transporter small permease [Desulfosarcina ovata]BBO85091.1 hypothetical protein DSCO28_56570 [Desulfosarcina ovata subsp. sediminis]
MVKDDFMKRIGAIFDKVLDGMIFVVGCLLIFIMLAVCADVLFRTFFDTPQIWVTEVIEVMLLYITFLGTAWLQREDGHVYVEILISRLDRATASFLKIISSLIGIFISIVLTVFGTSITLDYCHRGIYTPTAMEIPVCLIILVIPLGSFLLLGQFIRQTAINLDRFKKEFKMARRLKNSKGGAPWNGG